MTLDPFTDRFQQRGIDFCVQCRQPCRAKGPWYPLGGVPRGPVSIHEQLSRRKDLQGGQGFAFRREPQLIVDTAVIEWYDAHMVPGGHNPLVFEIDQYQGKHAPQVLDEGRT